MSTIKTIVAETELIKIELHKLVEMNELFKNLEAVANKLDVEGMVEEANVLDAVSKAWTNLIIDSRI